MNTLRLRRIGSLLVVGAMASAMALATFGAPVGTAQAASPTAAPWTVTVAPASDLVDGQLVSINLKTTTDHRIYEAQALICKLGVDYTVSDGDRPSPDFTAGDLNCPSIPISSSADAVAGSSNTYTAATEAGGETFDMYVGSGAVEWPASSNGRSQRLQCDSENPCALVVEVYGSVAPGEARWIPFVQTLNYKISDPISGCGGPADGILNGAGSERVTDLWIDWTLDQCHLPGVQAGAASRSSFSGEGDAMDGFSNGSLDLAYSALGYDAGAEFGLGTRAEPLTPRGSSAVPLALNATVIAVGNGLEGANGHKVPFTDVRITRDQLAHMFTGGPSDFNTYSLDSFLDLNPQFRTASVFLPTSIQVGAIAPADASTWFFTSMLKTTRPSLWKVPDTNQFGPERGLTRGAVPAFGVATPSFNGAVDMFTGNSVLVKTLRSQNLNAYGGIWVLTDLATAHRLNLSVASIENANGDFVAPTAETMSAAIPTMTTTADGRLVPDPDATAAHDAVQPYPLTFVDYAIAPTSKLVTSACVGRTASQGLMNTWLTYATTDGQSKLPSGYVALTDDLRAKATDAIAKVGSVTPDCYVDGPPVTSQGPGGTDGAGGSGSGTGSNYRSTSAGSTANGTTPAATDGSASTAGDAQLVAAEIPVFGSRSSASAVTAFLGLLIVFMLLSGMALMTTGRLPSPRAFVQNLRGSGS